jgi:Ricin-type beta-trefoil lectin domain-like
MGLLDALLGDPSQQQDYQDFAGRYQQGPPHEGYTDQEVLQRYQQVAPNLSPQEYQAAAEQAYARLSPHERLQFGQHLQQQAQQRGYTGFGMGAAAEQYQDPAYLAQATTQLHQQQPGLLGALLGGGGGGGNPLAKAALAGIAATAVSKALGGGLGGVLGGGGLSGGTRYRIANLASGKLLADPQGSRDNGTKIVQWDDDGGAEQRWELESGRHGGVLLRNAASGKVLANPQGSQEDGTEMIQWDAYGGPEQEWTIEPGRRGVRLRNLASRKLLANPQASRDNGTVIIQWRDDGGPEQEWLFDPPLR